jgi:hypothetical protein
MRHFVGRSQHVAVAQKALALIDRIYILVKLFKIFRPEIFMFLEGFTLRELKRSRVCFLESHKKGKVVPLQA